MSERRPRKKIPEAELPALEEAMYSALRPWGETHQDKPDSGITLIDYDRDRYPEQRINEYVTDAWLPFNSLFVPDKARMWALRNFVLAKALGSKALAKDLVNDFKSVSGDVADMIDEGKNVALVPAHKHYVDIGIAAGSLTIAMGKSRYIGDNTYQSVNKLMAIEKYHGWRIARFTTLTGKILWVIPSEGAKKYNVPHKAMYAVGTGGEEALNTVLEDPDKGVLFAVAFTGGAMDEVRNENNELAGLKFRKIPDGLGASMQSFDAAVPFAYDLDEDGNPVWEVGEILLPPAYDDAISEDERGKQFTDSIYMDLQSRMERLTGLQVDYDVLAPQIAAGILAVESSTSRGSYPG